MYSYQQELLKGYRRVYTAKNGYVETAKNWEYSEKETQAAKLLADNGHTIYMLPRNTKATCPDMLIDGQVGEIKQLRNGTTTAVDNEIRDASHQRARIVFLQIPANINAPLNKLIETAKRRMARSGTIKKILLYFNGEIKDI